MNKARLAPLVLATMASQALLVVLSPTIVAIAVDLGTPVGTVGQARSITASTALAVSVAIAGRVGIFGVQRLLVVGAAIAIIASGAVAVSPNLPVFLAMHLLVGVGFALLLTAGFAGLAAFPREMRASAIGHVSASNALAWIVVNPIVGVVTDQVSWRTAHAVPAAIALAALATAGGVLARPDDRTIPRLRELFSASSARRWLVAELIAYGAWTGLLTFVGAFFIEILGVREAIVGWLLALGAAAYFIASTRSGTLTKLLPRRRLVAAAAVIMAGLLVVQLNWTGSVAVAVTIFCLIGLAAGVRTPGSSGLGLEQLPDHPGAMMAARTAATQLGYLLGALIGGAVIAGPGYGALGILLAGAMILSALLILRVDDPLERTDDSDDSSRAC